jgi:hypothetical protein
MRVRSPVANCGGATVAFWALVVVAVPLYLALGRHWWFYLDEWDFIVSRRAGNATDLLRPHNQHWTTLPILAWRFLWRFFGVRSYFAYQALSVGLHVIVAALVRRLMRRALVGPWIATGAAGAFLFFGAGAQNVLSAFQITFTGALAFGFAGLLLADHAGPLDRRDAFALLAGLFAIMCSGVGVTMVAVAGVAVWMRRGFRLAAIHTVPLLGIYGAWYARYGRSASKFTGSIGQIAGFVRSGIAATFGALGQLSGSGYLLAAMLAAGLALVWRTTGAGARRARLAIPAALLAGVVLFFVMAAVGHKAGPGVVELPAESRYLYVGAALVIPVLAVAADALARRSLLLGCVAIALVLIGLPGNLGRASDFARLQARHAASSRDVILSIARMPLSARAPGSLRPDPVGAPSVTLGWLRAEAGRGRLPTLLHPGAALLAGDQLRLSLMELDVNPGRACEPLTAPVVRHLGNGDRIGIGDGAVTVTLLSSTRPAGVVSFGNVLFRSSRLNHDLVSVLGRLTLRIAPLRGHRAQLC